MKKAVILLFVFGLQSVWAQTLKSKVDGCWQSMDSLSINKKNYLSKEVLIFVNDDFQKESPSLFTITSENTKPFYTESKGKFSVGEQDSSLALDYEGRNNTFSYKIISVGDSLLTIAVADGPYLTYYHYKKITRFEYTPEMPPSEPVFYLVNSLDSTKKVELDAYDEFLFYLKDRHDSIIDGQTIFYDGRLTRVNQKSITLNLNSENFDVLYVNGSNFQKTSTYYKIDEDSLLEMATKNLDIAEIQYLKHCPNAKQNWRAFGAFITGSAAFTSLVVAPLISFNYKTGQFNNSTYFKTLAWCGVGLSVGIPLSTLPKKKYNLITGKDQPATDSWYLKSGQ